MMAENETSQQIQASMSQNLRISPHPKAVGCLKPVSIEVTKIKEPSGGQANFSTSAQQQILAMGGHSVSPSYKAKGIQTA